MDKIRVMIVEDDKGWAKAMKSFLKKQNDMVVVGIATSRDEAVKLASEITIEIILMDINLSGNKKDGIYAALEILQFSKAKIIMLSSMDDEEIVMDSFTAGALYYIYKSNYLEIPSTIRSILCKNSPMDILMKEYSRLKKQEQIENLSPAEKEIFRLMEKGYTKSQLEKELLKSPNTLKLQIRNILSKLGVKTRKEAVKKVSLKGLIDKK